MSFSNKKGFTLIELLVVIAIIGILAVAFVPRLLDAPKKARDTQRVANLTSIQQALMYGSLNSVAFPATGCADAVITDAKVLANLGGKVPVDPSGATHKVTAACAGKYYYVKDPNGAGAGAAAAGTYSFGLYALMESVDKANAKCTDAFIGKISAPDPADAATWCYAVLAQ